MGKATNGISYDRQWVREHNRAHHPVKYYGDLGRGKDGKQVFADLDDVRRSRISLNTPRRVLQIGEFPVILSCERGKNKYGNNVYHVDVYSPRGDELISTGSTTNKESLDYCLKETFKDIGVQVSDSKNVSNVPCRRSPTWRR